VTIPAQLVHVFDNKKNGPREWATMRTVRSYSDEIAAQTLSFPERSSLLRFFVVYTIDLSGRGVTDSASDDREPGSAR